MCGATGWLGDKFPGISPSPPPPRPPAFILLVRGGGESLGGLAEAWGSSWDWGEGHIGLDLFYIRCMYSVPGFASRYWEALLMEETGGLQYSFFSSQTRSAT